MSHSIIKFLQTASLLSRTISNRVPRACEADDSVKPGAQTPGSSAISLEPVKRATALKFSSFRPTIVKQRRLFFILLTITLASLVNGTPVLGQTTSFTFQGHLTDAGTAANGNYDFQFSLWDNLTNGTQIGSTQTLNSITVSNGVFTVSLDFGANVFPGANRFLEIRSRRTGTTGFTILEPRQQVTATPYSVRSVNASSADTLSTVCAGCVQNAQINSVAASKVTGTVAIANGGTGSSVKSFVDLNTNQTIAGVKSFAGNVGIGTTTPTGQLHVDGGSNLTFTRTSGRSPVFAAGTGASNQEFLMGYVTQAGDYVGGSETGDSFLFPSSNTGKTYIGRVTGNTALMTVDNSQGIVAIGINTNAAAAKLDVNGGSNGGVRGRSTDSGSLSTGVTGESSGGSGVVGISSTGVAVRAISTSGHIFEGQAGAQIVFRVTNSGQVCAANVGCASDLRLKRNVRPLAYGLNEVLLLTPRRWQWKDATMNQLSIGLIAQEVEPVLPELVLHGSDDKEPLGLNYLGLVPILVKGMQEQQAQIKRQQELIERQHKQFAQLQQQLNALKRLTCTSHRRAFVCR